MSELYRMPAAGAAPTKKVYILEEPPSRSQGPAPSQRPQVDPKWKILEWNPNDWAPRWSVVSVAVLLALSCLLWAVLHGVSMRNQGEMREELELLREKSGNWDLAWQELLQVQWHQMELDRITDLLCQTINNSNKCPEGWQFHKNACYLFSEIPQSWGKAQNSCATFSAHLVVVSTEKEQMFLVENIQRNNSYWMGVMNEQHKGKWTWITGETPSFGFWDVWSEDPDKEHKDCGAMKSNGRWIGEHCSKLNRWICEKSWDCHSSPFPPIPEKSAPAL
ncbi:PREDICTED: hepatic lectin-like [Pseudopodoces humilis]|uniref:hepatic lectin-like n=1 Tax=Pseudopodoces humilis TaxID=181119 RepID=UPI0006B6FB6F|nr:PREDICTED: hepatic lectin-like [Pseudopodoces humilis]